MFPFYRSLSVSTSQRCKPIVYNIFTVFWPMELAVTQAGLLLIRMHQFFSVFRLYTNYLSHIKSDHSYIYIYSWEKVVNTRGHSLQAQPTPRLSVMVRFLQELTSQLGARPHQLCSCTTDELYWWHTHLQGFPLVSNGSVVTCTVTKTSQSAKMQQNIRKTTLLQWNHPLNRAFWHKASTVRRTNSVRNASLGRGKWRINGSDNALCKWKERKLQRSRPILQVSWSVK